MANSVSDIVINIIANASQAIQGLNQVKTAAQNTASNTSSSMGGYNKSMTGAADTTTQAMATANTALTTFETQAGLSYNGAGQRMGKFANTAMIMSNRIQTATTNAGTRVSNFGRRIQGALGGQTAMAFGIAGAAALGFSKQCISAAMSSESAWSRYGALVSSSGGGNWQQQSNEVKKWARDVSNSYGYAVSDTREASATLMQAGNSFSFVQNNMQSVAALAARTGTTQAEASQMIVSALNGRAQALKKATGLEIENYRAADGTIDKQRLMTDILNQNKDALDAHSNTTEAAVARMENSWASLKTSLGTAMLPVIQTLVPIIQKIADAFNGLPAPVKTAIAAFLLIGGAIGVAVGFLGLIAPVFITAGEIIMGVGGIIAGVISTIGGAVAGAGGVTALLSTGFGALTAAAAPLLATLAPIIAVVAAVAAAFYLLYEAGKRMGWWNDLSGMISKFGETLSWVGGQIVGFAQWLGLLVTDFPQAMSKLGDFVNNIGPAISGFLSQLGPLLGTMGDVIVDALSGLGSWFMQAISSINLSDVANAMISPLGRILINAIMYVGPGILTAFEGLKDWAVTGLSNAFNNLGSTMGGIFNSITTGATNAIAEIGPQVSAAFDGLRDWLNAGLSNAINGLGSRVGEMFNGVKNVITGFIQGDMGSVFDGFVDLFGPILGEKIGSAVTTIYPAITNAFSRVGQVARQTLSNAWTNITAMFSQLGGRIIATLINIPTRVGMQFNRLVQVIRLRINQARAIAGTLMTNLRNVLIQRITSIPARVGVVFNLLLQAIRTRLTRAWAAAQQLAGQIRQAVVDKIMEMYHGAQSWFNNLAGNIGSWLATAASNTLAGAQNIYNNIINKIREIPGKVGDEFGKLGGIIKDKLVQAAQNALSGAASIVSSFLSGLDKHSPGKIQRETLDEFAAIPEHIETQGGVASSQAYRQASNIVTSWTRGMPQLGSPLTSPFNINTVTTNMRDMQAVRTNRDAAINRTVNNEDNTKHIIIQEINLDCNNLTQAQSRKILYNALDGL